MLNPNKPFFYIIGPEKTGTTWMYANLKNHKEVNLPNVKEIGYFWALQVFGKVNILTKIFHKHWHMKSRRGYFFNMIKKHLFNLKYLKVNKKQLYWDLHYFLGSYTDSYYKRLFDNDTFLSGDNYPKYCELTEEYIQRIQKIVPNAKIIISLRDPIARDWSWAKMSFLKFKGYKSYAENSEEIINYYKNNKHHCNNYKALIERWQKYFPKENIKILFYEDLQKQPQEFFDDICSFLNISKVQLPNVDKKVNLGIQEEIPSEMLMVLKNSTKKICTYLKNIQTATTQLNGIKNTIMIENKNMYVIIVTYNAMKWADKCFSSIRNSTIKTNVLVIDNGSTDGTQAFVTRYYPEVTFIQSEENLGFGAANNVAIEIAYKKGADFFYLMNQDAWVYNDSFEKLIKAYESYPQKEEIGIMSPMHLDGSEKRLDIFLDKYIATNFENRFISDVYLNEIKEYYQIKFINAAHWLLPKSTIEKIGGFNPFYFHYGEDNEYVNRVHFHTLKVILATQVKVVHDGKQNLDKVSETSFNTLSKETNLIDPNNKNVLKEAISWSVISIIKNLIVFNKEKFSNEFNYLVKSLKIKDSTRILK